jgi:hypothetical protein
MDNQKVKMKTPTLIATIMFGSALLSQAALTWSWNSGAPAEPYKSQITSAMNAAVNNYNTYALYYGNIYVTYNSGVPTAQTDGMFGLIEFGGYISARVAQHEMGHWIGCGTYWDWNNHRNATNLWTGVNATARIKAYNGPTAFVAADVQHFSPYGWNYDNEGPADRNIGMVGALRTDMGLNDGTIGMAAGTYRLQNRANGKMLDNLGSTANGSNVAQEPGGTSNNQKWVSSLSGGYSKLACITGGKYLDTVGHTADGSTVGQWASSTSYNQQWTITATDSGYYKLVNRANGKCLDNGGQTANGAAMQNRTSGSSYNQQWIFVQ